MKKKGPFIRRHFASRVFEILEARRLLSTTIYVDQSAPGSAGDGTSWNSAYIDLQQALAASVSGDQIKVADGTYRPTASTDRNATFQLKSGVSILGGYAGYAAANPDARDLSLNRTFLSGDIGTSGTISDNSVHVVTASGVDSAAVLDGFVVTAGNAAWPASSYGGGIFNEGGSPTISNCTFIANRSSYGGAIYNSGATAAPTISNCTFAGNNAGNYGGGICNVNGAGATITGCTFRGNYAYEGGGVNVSTESSATITDCTFTANLCQSGGGIYANFNSTLTVTGCTFERNVSTYQGGGMAFIGPASVNVRQCKFYGNTASSTGGGIYAGANGASGSVFQCLFVGNISQSGGGWYGGGVPAINCTFTANTASTGAALVHNNSVGQITNCILWGNNGQTISPSPSASSVITYSDVQNGATGTGNVSLDPNFMRLPSAGADANWGTADDFYGDLRMRGVTFAIDAGSNAAVPAGVTTDFAGAARFVDRAGFGSASTVVDMGAYESQPRMVSLPAPYTTLNDLTTLVTAVGTSFFGSVQYAWDLDNDGQFDDAVGAGVQFPGGSLPANSTVPIAVRVTDQVAQSIVAATTITTVQQTIYVDPRATGTGDGTSWSNAKTNLSVALAQSIYGQFIRVAVGTYRPSDIGDPTATFELKSGVSVLGGYGGIGAANPDARDLVAFETILSGDIGATGAAGDNSLHVVTATYVNAAGALDGFTITGGNADGRIGTPSQNGGGVLINGGSPWIRYCTFTGNSAHRGGAVNARVYSAPSFLSCWFNGNRATSEGGAMYNMSSASMLYNSIFVGNTAGYGGGALYNWDADFTAPVANPSIINCTFTANSTTLGGGAAMYDYYCSSTIRNSILWGNTSPQGEQIAQLNAATSVAYSDIQGGVAGTGNVSGDPSFVRSPSPGLDGTWDGIGDDYGDLRLQMVSPCVDTGGNGEVPVSIASDIAGRTRIFDFPGTLPVGPIVDMGAHELGMRLGLLHVPDDQTLALPPGGRTFVVEQLSIGAGATLDMRDNDLILDYSGTSPIGSWNGSSYNGVTGLIAAGSNGGGWDGSGLVTSVPDAATGLTTLGIGEAADTLGLGGSDTAIFSGETVDATCVLIKYTYTGDANLDGIVDGTDYFFIDSNISIPGAFAYFNGDFNYDGVVDGTDYFYIDSNISVQGPPL